MKKSILKTIICLSLSASCAFAMSNPSNSVKASTNSKTSGKVSSKNAPDWVTNPYSYYNSAKYLVAVGTGTDDNSAEDDAKADLVRVLKQNIEATQHVNLTATTRTEETTYTQDVFSAAGIKNLSGLSIDKKAYEDSRVYALAVLNRQEAADNYAKNIRHMDSKISEYITFAKSHSGELMSVIYAHKALTLASEIEYYEGLVSILNAPHAPDTSISYGSYVQLQHNVDEIKKSVPIHLIIEGDVKNQAAASIKKVFEQFGFIIQDADLPACPYSLVAGINIEKADASDDKHFFYTYDYSIEIIGNKKESYFMYSSNGRAGHVNNQGAKNRAMFMIKKDVETKFHDKLSEFINATGK